MSKVRSNLLDRQARYVARLPFVRNLIRTIKPSDNGLFAPVSPMVFCYK